MKFKYMTVITLTQWSFLCFTSTASRGLSTPFKNRTYWYAGWTIISAHLPRNRWTQRKDGRAGIHIHGSNPLHFLHRRKYKLFILLLLVKGLRTCLDVFPILHNHWREFVLNVASSLCCWHRIPSSFSVN